MALLGELTTIPKNTQGRREWAYARYLMHVHQPYWNSYFHVKSSSFLSFKLPDVSEHPLFYVGVYVLIGFTSATVSILVTATQYTIESVEVYFPQAFDGCCALCDALA
jgi:hypothetical protein